jgi:hypothetical protein
MAGGMDGFSHACGSVLVNVNWNDANRNWNVNDWNPDNDVNAGRRVFSGNSHEFSPDQRGGVFVSSPFFHPPIMRPISSVFSESTAYLLFSNAPISHATLKKNFNTSIRRIAMRTVGNFSVLLW